MSLISYRNLADVATVTSPSATVPGYPLDNLKARQLSQVTRWNTVSGGAAQIELVVDLGPNYSYMQRPLLLGLLGANVSRPSPSSDILLQAMVYDGTAAGGPWTLQFGGQVSDKAAATFPGNLIVGAGAYAVTQRRYWRVVAFWTTADSVASVGRLWLGDAIRVPQGVDEDWSLGVMDSGRLDSSAGGQVYETRRIRVRTLQVNLTAVPQLLAFGFNDAATVAADVPSFQAMQAEAGSTGEVIVLPREAPIWARRTGIYGHLESGVVIRKTPGPTYTVALNAIEER